MVGRSWAVRPGAPQVSGDRRWHLIAYDVRSEQRLRRVARHLEGYGERVQLSVFRCRLTSRARARLLWELAGILAQEDSLLVLPLCERCESQVCVCGASRRWEQADPPFRIV